MFRVIDWASPALQVVAVRHINGCIYWDLRITVPSLSPFKQGGCICQCFDGGA